MIRGTHKADFPVPLLNDLVERLPRKESIAASFRLCKISSQAWQACDLAANFSPVVGQVNRFVLVPLPDVTQNA